MYTDNITNTGDCNYDAIKDLLESGNDDFDGIAVILYLSEDTLGNKPISQSNPLYFKEKMHQKGGLKAVINETNFYPTRPALQDYRPYHNILMQGAYNPANAYIVHSLLGAWALFKKEGDLCEAAFIRVCIMHFFS